MLNRTGSVFTSLFLLLSMLSYAQQSEPVLSDKHIGNIEETENPVRKIKKYNRFFHRDSIRQGRQMNRFWKSQNDSIADAMESRQKALARKSAKVKDGASSKVYTAVYKPWAERQAEQYLLLIDRNGFKISPFSRQILHTYLTNYFLEASQNDKLLYSLKQQIPGLPLPKQLSSKISTYKVINASELQQQAKNKLNGVKGVGQHKSLQGKAQQYAGNYKKYVQYGNVLSNTDTLKGFVKTEGAKLAKVYASKLEGSSQFNDINGQLGEADKLKGLSSEYKGQMDHVQDSAYMKEQAKKKAEELAMQYIADHPEVMQGVQRKMSLLMKKYSVVPNSNDLSTAVKRTSLKGRTFFERLQVAANFQVISLDPISLDFSPQVGYKINSRFVMGAGGLYRKTFRDSIPTIAPDVLGYKGYTSYEVMGNFFVTGEYARNSPGINPSEIKSKRIWENTMLAGVGRKFLIHPKIEMTLMAGYNFLYSESDTIYPRPWVIRVGIQSSELAFLNKKRLQANNF